SDPVARALAEPTATLVEIRAGERTLSFTAIPMAEPGSAVLVFEDQTERRRLQEQLIQSEKMSAIGQLIAGVAHDLNNPLASVVGFSDFLAELGDIPPQFAEPRHVIRQEAGRAATIVKNLLSFARSQEGERKRQPIGSILESTLALLRNQLMANKVEATLEVEPGLPDVEVNGNQIKQVFVNLINNANQAIASDAPSGRIWVAAKPQRDGVAVSITDSGPGMTEEIAAHVFEPFFTTKGEGEGTGLGLSICQGIVKEHGGRITLDTKAGGGATFTVELPGGARTPLVQAGPAQVPAGGPHPAVPGNARPSLPPQTVYALGAARCARPRRQPTRLSMLRVLHVDSGREYRGGQDQVRLLARELARDPDVQQYLITRRGSELARRVATAGTPVHEVPWTIGLDPRAWWRLVLLARALRADVIHAHDGHALGIALAARRWLDAQPRMVATRRVVFPVRRRSSLFRADRIVAISAAVETVLVAAGVSPGEISVVPSGIDPDEVRAAAAVPFGIRARLGLSPHAPIAVNVAALEPAKDQTTLVRAAHAARTLRPDLHWVIAGAGDERGTVAAQIGGLGLTDRVHLLGHIAQADALIAESNLLVMSSKEEG